MSETSRRRFIGVAGAGAAATGAAVLIPGAAATAQTRLSGDSAQAPVVAYVENIYSNAVVLMVDERELVVHDRDLVNRLLNAAGGE